MALATVLFASVLWMTLAGAEPLSIGLPGARAFPESITSTSDGTLFVGRLGEGGIVRADLRTGAVTVFVAPGASGSRSITGVFADDASGILWACSNDLSSLGGPSGGRDHASALKGFDLSTGAAKRNVPLPGPNAFCNDIAVDGNLYVTTYAAGGLFRIDVDRGRAGRVTKIHGATLTLPDALRPLGQRSFLLIEGGGTLDRVDVEGDGFKAVPIRNGFRAPTSVARVGSTAWVSEGQLSFFFDRARKGQSPSLPFRIYAVPLSKRQT